MVDQGGLASSKSITGKTCTKMLEAKHEFVG